MPDFTAPVKGPNWQYEMVYLAVLSERNPPRWSPDGRYLAFAAAVDGPSADLYVYDTRTDRVRRLTDGLNQAAIMGWSPDSRWIIHAEASTYMIQDGGEIGGFPAEAVWAAAADGSELRRLYGPAGTERLVGWLSPEKFVVQRWSGYIYLHDLRVVDLRTGARFVLYNGEFYSSAAAPDGRTAVVDSTSDSSGEEVDSSGGLTILPTRRRVGGLEPVHAARLEWVPQLERFLAAGFTPPFLFDTDGQITDEFGDEAGWPAVSPDGRWLTFGLDPWNEEPGERPGLRLYGIDGRLVREVSREKAFNFEWASDSSGLYYLVDEGDSSRLMYVSLPNGEPLLLNSKPGFDRFFILGAAVR